MSRLTACRTLGPVELLVDGGAAPPELLWKKNLALLVYLARSGPRGRTREHLAGLLWPEKPESLARQSLNEALRHLRRTLGDDAVDATPGQVRLAPGAVDLDVDELQAHIERGEWAKAARLATGEFLEGFSVPDASALEDWLAAERAHWRERSLDALSRFADALLREGNAAEAVTVARRASLLEPRSERAARALIRALALAGDRAAALDAYAGFATRVAELGTEPSPELAELAARVSRQRLARPEPAAATPARARLPLIGRALELQRLLDAVASCRTDARAALLTVQGENGTGKTRLVEELLARLRLDGVGVSAARAVESDRTEPWSGIILLARGGLVDAAGVSGAPPDAIAAMAAHTREWAERFPGAPGTTAAQLGRAVTDIVRVAADEQPIVLAVDDAQWLDDASTAALIGLLRDLVNCPVVVVLSYSPYLARPDLDELRTRIGRDLAGCAVQVGPLSPAGVRELAERLLPTFDAVELDRLARRVAADSACLPLLAVELLRAVALGLDLGAFARAWPEPERTMDQSLPGDLPDALVAAVRIECRRLSPEAQRVLAAAAVLGDPVSDTRLARALEAPIDVVHRALDELEWQHWLLAGPRGYGFTARLVRTIVERDMVTPGQQRRLLQRDAET